MYPISPMKYETCLYQYVGRGLTDFETGNTYVCVTNA